jgi:GT2 family glycosyltransferase
MKPLVSIITVNFRDKLVTTDLLDSLRQISYDNIELLLVDNGMLSDERAHFEAHFPGVKVINSRENLGFAGGNNLAIAQAKGDYVLLLNNDTIVPADFLQPLVRLLEDNPRIGIVSPKIYYYDEPNRLQYAGKGNLDFRTGRGQDEAKLQIDHGQFDQLRETDFTHGACMLVRKKVFSDIGLLTEDYFLYYEELDFCLRARRSGWQLYFTPDTYILHRESASVGKFSPLKTYYMSRNRWLLISRFAPSTSYCMFVAYYLGIGLPLNILRFAAKGKWEHIKALWRSVSWNLGLSSTSRW